MARFRKTDGSIKFEITIDTKGDTINLEKWESEIKKLLNDHYYVQEVRAERVEQ